MMANERITEGFVRDHFMNDPLFNAIKLDEQRTSDAKARRCLAEASKQLTGKRGFPEFIISFPALPDDIIVVECKVDTKSHKSRDGESPAAFAVDGALHYSNFLAKEYNVISIAVSGVSLKKLKISSFFQAKGETEVVEEDSTLLDIFSYIERLGGGTQAQSIESAEITKTAIDLNNDLNDYSIAEYERCALISAVLLALQNEAFKASYKEQARSKNYKPTPERLAAFIVSSIQSVLKDAGIDNSRISSMMGEYKKIKNHAIATSSQIKRKKASEQIDNYVLRGITERLEKSILPLITMGDKGYDVLGRFYREFIRYAGTDQRTGLVLTPQHITEFFCDIVGLNTNDVVFDPCCGTGGFLISAMKHMLRFSGADQRKKSAIKKKQLIGIEKRTDMFTFACSNMMMSGDGKSHIYQGDSFAPEIIEKVRSLKPTVAFLNPPYDVGADGQLEFIENALACLQSGGKCAAIVQMSCSLSAKSTVVSVRERLLRCHTLTGVFSMPDELFCPVGVVTCIMVFEAHKPHPKRFKTSFGYFKDDGFHKTKRMGRINKGEWDSIKAKWSSAYLNHEELPSFSVKHAITAKDEWCAEAHMETNYSHLEESVFETTLHNYCIFLFANKRSDKVTSCPFSNNKPAFNTTKWGHFALKDLFNIAGSTTTSLLELEEYGEGNFPYVTTQATNNGIDGFYCCGTESGGVLTVDSAVIGYCAYQPFDFSASDHVEILCPKFEMNKYVALFLVSIINCEQYRYNYGRKCSQARLRTTSIRLPSKKSSPDYKYMENYIKSLPYSKSI